MLISFDGILFVPIDSETNLYKLNHTALNNHALSLKYCTFVPVCIIISVDLNNLAVILFKRFRLPFVWLTCFRAWFCNISRPSINSYIFVRWKMGELDFNIIILFNINVRNNSLDPTINLGHRVHLCIDIKVVANFDLGTPSFCLHAHFTKLLFCYFVAIWRRMNFAIWQEDI